MTDTDTALRHALTVALSVVLHETLDPECSGEPPYDQTEALADRVMSMPNVLAALAAASPSPLNAGTDAATPDTSPEVAAQRSTHRKTTPACKDDPRCFRNDGHKGDHAYPTRLAAASPPPLDVVSDGDDRHVLSNGVVIYGTRRQAEIAARAYAAEETIMTLRSRKLNQWEIALAAAAVVKERDRVRTAVAKLQPVYDEEDMTISNWYFDGFEDARAAVLNIIDHKEVSRD